MLGVEAPEFLIETASFQKLCKAQYRKGIESHTLLELYVPCPSLSDWEVVNIRY